MIIAMVMGEVSEDKFQKIAIRLPNLIDSDVMYISRGPNMYYQFGEELDVNGCVNEPLLIIEDTTNPGRLLGRRHRDSYDESFRNRLRTTLGIEVRVK